MNLSQSRSVNCRPGLQQSSPGMILENLRVANVTPQRVDRAVPAHIHHLEQARSARRGRRQKPSPQAMAGEHRGVEPDPSGMSLYDSGDALIAKPIADFAAALMDRPE